TSDQPGLSPLSRFLIWIMGYLFNLAGEKVPPSIRPDSISNLDLTSQPPYNGSSINSHDNHHPDLAPIEENSPGINTVSPDLNVAPNSRQPDNGYSTHPISNFHSALTAIKGRIHGFHAKTPDPEAAASQHPDNGSRGHAQAVHNPHSELAASTENSQASNTASPDLGASTSWHANSETRHADGNHQSSVALVMKKSSGNSRAQRTSRNIKSLTSFFSRPRMPCLSPSSPMPRSETIQIRQDRHTSLDQKHIASFYRALRDAPDEETLDKAIQALPSLLLNTKRSSPKGPIYATHEEVLTLQYLLSLDLSVRFNLAAAEHISTSVSCDDSHDLPAVLYPLSDVADLIDALCVAGERDTATHLEMTKAIAYVLDSVMAQVPLVSNLFSGPAKSPLFALLFVPFFSLPLDPRHQQHVQLRVVNHVYRGFQDMLEGYSVLHRKPEVYSIVYIADQVGLSLLTVEQLNTYDVQSRVPFLLNILPSNLDKEDPNNNQSVSFRWFRSFVELYFSPTTELQLQVVVESVHEVVKFYHRNRSYFSKTRSHNLFATTEFIVGTLKASLNRWKHEKATYWRPVFEACLPILRHMFPTEQITELYDATDLRWCLQIVIPVLKHIMQMVPFAQLQKDFLLPSDLKDILRSETANAVLRRVDDSQVKGAELLEIFRSIDPSL
ncbi:hypothetical protein H0H93_003874, partial [Arthromyces matolae]